MKRAWAAIPATRIVQDILRYPDALQAVVDAQGGMPDIVKRRGRRSTLMLPTPARRLKLYGIWLFNCTEVNL